MTLRRYALTLLMLLVCNGVQAAITAPDSVPAGELAVCKSNTPATWAIYPQEYRGSYYVADGGSVCIFASPVKGAVTIVAAAADPDSGSIEIAEHTLYNGIEAPAKDDATDLITPAPAPETIASVIASDSTAATASDYTALANAFEAAVSGIDRGTITTPAGARETFRAVWVVNAAKTNPEALTAFIPLLDKLSGMIDYTDLATTKKDYKAIIEALKVRAAALSATSKKTKAPQRQCPNGNCNKWGW